MKRFQIIAIISIITMIGCASALQTIQTITDIAHTLCMLAASEREEGARTEMDDDAWCLVHGAEYIAEVKRAKAMAGRRAGIGVE